MTSQYTFSHVCSLDTPGVLSQGDWIFIRVISEGACIRSKCVCMCSPRGSVMNERSDNHTL